MASYPSAGSIKPLFVSPGQSRVALALLALTKPGLAVMSSLTTVVTYLATAEPGRPIPLALVAGTLLSAAGTLSFNQWREWRIDALMARTRGRPLPQGVLTPSAAIGWSGLLTAGGMLILMLQINRAAAMIAALTSLLYGSGYTLLKRRTLWATEVGAVAGALPPLIGSAATGHTFAGVGVALFLILLFWQMPHFYAIGWRHRDDYRAAGFALLPAVDHDGHRTARRAVFYTGVLSLGSLLPVWIGTFGAFYAVVSLLAGAHYLRAACRLLHARGDRDPEASAVFRASLLYLPLILGAIICDRALCR